MIECCDDELSDQQANDCKTHHTKDYGKSQECDGDKVFWGMCGSGAHWDCSTTGNDANVDMTCCDKGVKIDGNCVWLWGKYGQQLSCPAGQVGHGVCGSGQFDDCNKGKANSGIQCCSYKAK